jgi:hypothetical protein
MSARRAVRDARGDPDAMAKDRHLVEMKSLLSASVENPSGKTAHRITADTRQKTLPMPSGSPALKNRPASKQQRCLGC